MLSIRSELPTDLDAIYGVNCAAFSGDAEARIVDALRTAGRLAISLIAEEKGELVGHVAFSPVSAPGTQRGLGLGPVAVSPFYQRRGIGMRLVREGLDAAVRLGTSFVVVIGEPSYYERFGFRAAEARGLHDEFGAGAFLQVLELVEGAIPRAGGLVRFAPEFGPDGLE